MRRPRFGTFTTALPRGTAGRARRGTARGLRVAALALLTLGLGATPAAALSVSIVANQHHPQVGEYMSFQATPSEPDVSYFFHVDDGPVEPAQAGEPGRFLRSFGTAGRHKVTVVVSNESLQRAEAQTYVDVVEPLAADVTWHPSDPRAGEPVTFVAEASGGHPPLEYQWDFEDSTNFNAKGRVQGHIFPAPGTYVVRMVVEDAREPRRHFQHLTRVVSVGEPRTPPPPPGSSTPTAPACKKELTFQLTQITTADCLSPVPGRPGRWLALGGRIDLNGITLQTQPSSTLPITIDEPDSDHKGGRLRVGRVKVNVGEVVLRKTPGAQSDTMSLDLDLPPGSRQALRALGGTWGLRPGTTLGGQPVTGDTTLRIGVERDEYFSILRLNVQLPDPIRNGPPISGASPQRPTTEVSLLAEKNHVHYEDVVLHTRAAFIGDLPLGGVCYAFTQAAAKGRCPDLPLDQKPFLLDCFTQPTGTPWYGIVDFELPTAAAPRFAAATMMSGSNINALGLLIDNFGGPSVFSPKQLIEGVGLNRIGLGLCEGSPVQIRGDIGVSILGNRFTKPPIELDGSIHYVGRTAKKDWSLTIAGAASLFTKQFGEVTVTIRPSMIDLSADAKLSVAKDKLSLSGAAAGWLELDTGKFHLRGDVRACVLGKCGGAIGLVTSTGVAGCVIIEGAKLGAGYKWSTGEISIMAGYCGLKPYKVKQTPRARAAAAGDATVRIQRGAEQFALKIPGTTGAPKVRVTGPGLDISSPATESTAAVRGRYVLLEDADEKVTHVMLVKPPAGTYTISALDPANPVGVVQSAGPDRPLSASARVTRSSRGRRTLRMSYLKPEGSTVRIVERGRRSQRTLVGRARPARCKGRPKSSPRRCLVKTFRPADGPGGARTIEAVVERGGIPLETKRIARYRLPSRRRVAKPRVRVYRRGSVVRIAWLRAARAASYVVSAKLGDGRSLTFRAGRNCRTVHIRRVRRNVRVSARVTGLRKDLRPGRTARATLKGGKRNRGSRKVRLRKSCA